MQNLVDIFNFIILLSPSNCRNCGKIPDECQTSAYTAEKIKNRSTFEIFCKIGTKIGKVGWFPEKRSLPPRPVVNFDLTGRGNDNLQEMARILDETMKDIEVKKKQVDVQVNESKTKAMASISEFEAGVLEKQQIAKSTLEAEAGSVSN